MKVSCQQDQLARALSTVGRAVASKTTLPVLSNILLATDTTGEIPSLKLAATNLEISITVTIPAQIAEPGQVTVPARILAEFINNLGKDASTVQLTLDPANLKLHIKGGRFEANVNGIAAEDFPNTAASTTATPYALIKASDLKSAIMQVAFAASTDETRPVLTGIFTKFASNKLTMAAADSFRLAVRTTDLIDEVSSPSTVLLPARAMTELARSLPDDASEVEISVATNRSLVVFKLPQFIFTSTLIEGTFPNYETIIPKKFDTRAVIETGTLSQAVKTAGIFAKDSGGNIVRLSVSPGEDLTPGNLLLTANASEVGDNRNEVDAMVDGAGAQIAFNARYMSEVLNVIDTSQVALELQTPSNPGVIKPVGKEDYIHVIMPMHLAPR